MESMGRQRAMFARDDEPSQPPPSFSIGGLRVDAIGFDDAVSRLLTPGRKRSVHLCNAFTVTSAAESPPLRDALNRGTLNLADGLPVVWAARRRDVPRFDRVSGPDLMVACLDRGRGLGTRHYLYGSTVDVVELLKHQIQSRWPGALVVGAESPPFGPSSDEELALAVHRFESADSDIVWVGLGTPKQDFEVDRLAAIGGSTFVAIGAAFDFIAGTKRRAPRWMQRLGLEWLFRLASEPTRLWRRYLIGNVQFLRILMLDR